MTVSAHPCREAIRIGRGLRGLRRRWLRLGPLIGRLRHARRWLGRILRLRGGLVGLWSIRRCVGLGRISSLVGGGAVGCLVIVVRISIPDRLPGVLGRPVVVNRPPIRARPHARSVSGGRWVIIVRLGWGRHGGTHEGHAPKPGPDQQGPPRTRHRVLQRSRLPRDTWAAAPP